MIIAIINPKINGQHVTISSCDFKFVFSTTFSSSSGVDQTLRCDFGEKFICYLLFKKGMNEDEENDFIYLRKYRYN